jgi:hypothetical protein
MREYTDVVFRKPKALKVCLFVAECTIPVLMLWGVRTAIEDGTVTNEPELFRNIMFGMFSPVICLRFCDLFGLRENNWFGGLQMFLLFYAPIGYLLAKLTGVL